MPNSVIEEEILSRLHRLAVEEQRRVLSFVRALSLAKPVGKPGKTLLRFAGMIEASDLDLMTKAVEEGCKQVTENE